MRYYHGTIFGEHGFFSGGFAVENGRFTELLPDAAAGDGVDLGGLTVLPGLVDIHIHGSAGADFSDGDVAGLERMARFLAAHGVTSFVPASMTLPYETLAAAFQTAAAFRERRPADCARLLGIHMEGPFLAEARKGAQNGAYLRAPDYSAFEALYWGCGGLIRLVDLAAELPGAAAFTRQAAKLCTVSVAHTAAAYEEAAAVFDAGASHLTHLYNAMPPLLHRAPGPIGAAS
ncbi:MAG: amidohydrolase family protein, partial [Oscillibacter sp.]|nr:amidohydrolase family protein [Oscillibacter sp.]